VGAPGDLVDLVASVEHQTEDPAGVRVVVVGAERVQRVEHLVGGAALLGDRHEIGTLQSAFKSCLGMPMDMQQPAVP
jgi:hypothetical protein